MIAHIALGLAAVAAVAIGLGAVAATIARDRTPRWRITSGVGWRCDQPPRSPVATLRPTRRSRPASHAADLVAAANAAILEARAAHAARHRLGADDLDSRFTLLPWEDAR